MSQSNSAGALRPRAAAQRAHVSVCASPGLRGATPHRERRARSVSSRPAARRGRHRKGAGHLALRRPEGRPHGARLPARRGRGAVGGGHRADQAAAAALIAQIASIPALATDPTAFPTFSFFGDQDYILNTPRGFSVYADASPNISNIQFSDANGLFQAVGRSETESFYVSGNLVFEKVPLVNSLRLAGGRREGQHRCHGLLYCRVCFAFAPLPR